MSANGAPTMVFFKRVARWAGTVLDSARSSTRGRLILFGTIGLSGFIPNLTTLFLLCGWLHINYAFATIVATQVAIAWNFVFTRPDPISAVSSGIPVPPRRTVLRAEQH